MALFLGAASHAYECSKPLLLPIIHVRYTPCDLRIYVRPHRIIFILLQLPFLFYVLICGTDLSTAILDVS
jgi:hypothetical protein